MWGVTKVSNYTMIHTHGGCVSFQSSPAPGSATLKKIFLDINQWKKNDKTITRVVGKLLVSVWNSHLICGIWNRLLQLIRIHANSLGQSLQRPSRREQKAGSFVKVFASAMFWICNALCIVGTGIDWLQILLNYIDILPIDVSSNVTQR